MNHETIEKSTFDVNGMTGLHRVRRRQKDGSFKVHLYAWRGGPRIEGETPEDVRVAFEAATASYRPAWKAECRPRAHEPSIKRICQRAIDNAKARSAKRGIDFSLTASRVLNLFKEQKGCCAISGLPFDIGYDPDRRYTYNPYGVSIDRIDCQKGYTQRNVRLVLTAVNFGLNEWGEDTYLRIARAVVARDLMSQVSGRSAP